MEIHSPAKEWQKQQDAMNAAQKDDLKYHTAEKVKEMDQKIQLLTKSLEALRGRVERLETEGGDVNVGAFNDR